MDRDRDRDRERQRHTDIESEAELLSSISCINVPVKTLTSSVPKVLLIKALQLSRMSMEYWCYRCKMTHTAFVCLFVYVI